VVNIRDLGAVPDGQRISTDAIQQAIDHVHAAGGGVVLIPPGTFVTGSLLLKDNVCMHLEHGATLLASPRREDYNAGYNLPGDSGYAFENVGCEHLIVAAHATNIALTGEGCIDGNAGAFIDLTPDVSQRIRGWRPGQMIVFYGCRQVRVRNIHLRNSPYWALRPWGCTGVVIHGVRIEQNSRIPNGDGIDIDACGDVVISDCIINSSDDCITLRGCELPGLERRDCENVAVSNCVLSTRCSCLRIGVGNGSIRNAVFSNLILRNRDGRGHGINFMPWKFSRTLADGRDDPRLPADDPVTSDIRFSNIVMDVVCPLRLWSGTDDPDGEHRGHVSAISFHGCSITGQQASMLEGTAERPMREICLTDVQIRTTGRIDAEDLLDPVPQITPRYGLRRGVPHALFMRHVDGLSLHGVRLNFGPEAHGWQSSLHLDRCQRVQRDGVSA